jgi:hypothetical protein
MSALGRATAAPATAEWSRPRLLAILASAVAAALLLAAGFGYAVYLALGPTTTDASAGPETALSSEQMHSRVALGMQRRDQIAARPMLAVGVEAMNPTTPTTQLAQSIEIPAATDTGPDNVPSGFPHTDEGAIGQLAALTQTVLDSMSVSVAHHVYDDWAMPGGVGANRWQMTVNVTSFLGAAAMGPAIAPGATVSAIAAGAQTKGTDGPDWTVACVLFEVDATISAQASIGYGTCERMQWNADPEAGPGQAADPDAGRWMIAPGTPPSPAPSTWPGSALALEAGWLTWLTVDAAPPPVPDTVDRVDASGEN